MRNKAALKSVFAMFVVFALFLAVKWSAILVRSQQFSEAVNNWQITEAENLESTGVRKDSVADLRFQIQKGNVRGVKQLLSKGADANFQDDIWNAPLLFAAIKDSTPIIKILIEEGADVNMKDHLEHHGTTALITAAGLHNYNAVKTLIKCGANLYTRTAAGNTALDAARQFEASNYSRQVETIRVLRAAGAVSATSKPLSFEARMNFIR